MTQNVVGDPVMAANSPRIYRESEGEYGLEILKMY